MHPVKTRVHRVVGSVVKSTIKYWFVVLIEPAVPAVFQRAKVLGGCRDRERFQGAVREARRFVYERIKEAKKKYPDLVLDVDVMVLPIGEASEKNMTRARGVEKLMTELARRVLYGS